MVERRVWTWGDDPMSSNQSRAPSGVGRTSRNSISTVEQEGTEELTAPKKKMVRFNLNLPDDVVMRLEVVAEEKGTTVQTLIRRFLILGLTAVELEKNPEDGLIVRRGGIDRLVTFF